MKLTAILAAALLLLLLAGPVRSQDFGVENNGGDATGIRGTVIVRDRQVSAANTAQSFVYDLGNINQVLVVVAVCSAGTATLAVSASSDNTNFITIDSLTAAASNLKNYNNSTAGASTAVSPLAFRWVKIAVGTCGASNTSTLTVAGK